MTEDIDKMREKQRKDYFADLEAKRRVDKILAESKRKPPVVSLDVSNEGDAFLCTGELNLTGHDGIVTSAWGTSRGAAVAAVLRILARDAVEVDPGNVLDEEAEQ